MAAGNQIEKGMEIIPGLVAYNQNGRAILYSGSLSGAIFTYKAMAETGNPTIMFRMAKILSETGMELEQSDCNHLLDLLILSIGCY